MFRPYMWAIFRRFILQISYKDVWGVWVGGWGWGEEISFFNSGYHDPGLLQVDFLWLFMCTFLC